MDFEIEAFPVGPHGQMVSSTLGWVLAALEWDQGVPTGHRGLDLGNRSLDEPSGYNGLLWAGGEIAWDPRDFAALFGSQEISLGDFGSGDPGIGDPMQGNVSEDNPADDDNGEVITVTARRYKQQTFFEYDFGSTGGGGGGFREANDTPCVEAAPAGVSLEELNNAALTAALYLARADDETFEIGSIFYLSDGVLGRTTLFSQRYTDFIDWDYGIGKVPNGAVIVAILHNHPDEGGINDLIPSPGDWTSYNSFHKAEMPRGITVDRNMLMYIYSNEDGSLRAYDNTDKGDEQATCPL